jgi:hypothetical protein
MLHAFISAAQHAHLCANFALLQAHNSITSMTIKRV